MTMNHRRIGRAARIGASLGLVALLSAGLAGCDQAVTTPSADLPANESSPGGSAAAEIGSIRLELTLPGDFRVNTVDYQISRANFRVSGSLPVANSQTISGVVGGLLAGTGYVVTLSTTDVDHRLAPCQGSSPFDVTAAMTTPVNVHLACHEALKTPIAQVPVGHGATFAIAALLLGLGSAIVRRRPARGLNSARRPKQQSRRTSEATMPPLTGV